MEYKNNTYRFKELITNLTYDMFEVKEPLKIVSIGCTSTLQPGKQFSVILLEMMTGVRIKYLIDKEAEKIPESSIWKLTV